MSVQDPGDALATDRLAVRELGQSQQVRAEALERHGARTAPPHARLAAVRLLQDLLLEHRHLVLAALLLGALPVLPLPCCLHVLAARAARVAAAAAAPDARLVVLRIRRHAPAVGSWEEVHVSTGRLMDCMPDVNQGSTRPRQGRLVVVCRARVLASVFVVGFAFAPRL